MADDLVVRMIASRFEYNLQTYEFRRAFWELQSQAHSWQIDEYCDRVRAYEAYDDSMRRRIAAEE